MINVTGVAKDLGDPNAHAIGPDGKVTKREFKLEFMADEDGVLRAAKDARLRGDNEGASRLEGLVGKTAPVSFVERHPIAVGFGAGAVVIGATWGTVYLIKRRRAKKAAEQLQPPTRMRAVR
jgi:hypothetical protein